MKESQIGLVHVSNILSGKSFLEPCVNGFLMQTRFKKTAILGMSDPHRTWVGASAGYTV